MLYCIEENKTISICDREVVKLHDYSNKNTTMSCVNNIGDDFAGVFWIIIVRLEVLGGCMIIPTECKIISQINNDI